MKKTYIFLLSSFIACTSWGMDDASTNLIRKGVNRQKQGLIRI